MAENLTNATVCTYPGKGANDVFNHIVSPALLFFSGVFGHSIAAFVFYKESKKNAPYIYQAWVQASEVFAAFFATLNSLCNGLGTDTPTAQPWFRSSYVLKFYHAYIDLFACFSSGTVLTLLTVVAAADRFFALWKPVAYRTWNHKKIRAISIGGSVGLGILSNVFLVFHYTLSYDGVYYIMVDDKYYQSFWISKISQAFLAFLQFFAVFMLLVCNIGGMIALCAIKQASTAINDKRAQERKAAEKTLLFVTVCESGLELIRKIFFVGVLVMDLLKKGSGSCASTYVSAIFASVEKIRTIADIYLYLIFSKPFRRSLMANLRFSKPNSVVSINVLPPNEPVGD